MVGHARPALEGLLELSRGAARSGDRARNLSEALRQPGPCLVEVTARIPWPPIETTAGMFAQAEVSTE